MAATEASGGAPGGCGARPPRNCRRRERTGATMSATPQPRSMLITHEVGLHARPSVKFTKLAKSFAAAGRDGAAAGRPVVRRQEHRQGDGGQGAEGHGAAFARRGRGRRTSGRRRWSSWSSAISTRARPMPAPLRLKGIAALGRLRRGAAVPAASREERSYLASGQPHRGEARGAQRAAHAAAAHRAR